MLPARIKNTLGWMAIDAALLVAALAFAYQLAFDFNPPQGHVSQFQHLLIPIVALELLLLWLTGLYRRMMRFAGTTEMLLIGGALTAALAAGLLHFYWMKALGRTGPPLPPWQWPIPRSVMGINWLSSIAVVGGARLSRRLMVSWPSRLPPGARRGLIVGTNSVGDFAARMLKQSPEMRAVAFLDESGINVGRTLQGLPVVGSIAELRTVIRGLRIDEVLVALPTSEADIVNQVAEQCRHDQVPVRVLPSENELIAGRRTLGALRPVDVHEVLGRERVDLTLEESLNYLRGEVVLVTGAGGSIGSELCRQIVPLGPRRLLMLGRGENSLFELAQTLGAEDASHQLLLANICDEPKMRHLFAEHRPTVIFHAAAHKHVHMMESAPDEAVKNNILATDLLAGLAHEHGTKRFVFISTDKAVRPSSIMGASKRVAEQIVLGWASRSPVRYVAVRFGNVLGSRGSVVPIFRRQIERGGPVTVTDPHAERYFMTVEEATALVLRAGAVGESGQLCVLDMGEPVLIQDLARNLITLSGLEPGVDIEIQHVGLRPGEKLKEEYLSAQEGLEKTSIGKIFVTRPKLPDSEGLAQDLATLREAAQRGEIGVILKQMEKRVPDYRPARRDDLI